MAQLVRIGTDTLPLAFLVSLFVGMVLVVQAADQLQQYTQEILGSIVGLAMTKELGPVIMGFLIAGRVGSAMAAEIGSMNVNDEINALKTMDIDPMLFLSVPRLHRHDPGAADAGALRRRHRHRRRRRGRRVRPGGEDQRPPVPRQPDAVDQLQGHRRRARQRLRLRA